MTAWLALTVADETNGCLRVVPGSHGLAAQPLDLEANGTSLFGARMDYALVDESVAVSIEAEPGDLVLHHPNLVHGSWPTYGPRPAWPWPFATTARRNLIRWAGCCIR